MTPCEADRHCNWTFATGEAEAELTIHDLTVTGECVQLLCKPTIGHTELFADVNTCICGLRNYMNYRYGHTYVSISLF